MGPMKKAHNSALQFMRMLAGITECVEIIDGFASLEEAEEAAKQRVADLHNEEGAAKDRLARTIEEAEDIRQKGAAWGTEHIAKVTQEANAMIARAQAELEERRARAEADHAERQAAGEKQLAKIDARIAARQQDITAKQAQDESLDKQIAERTAKLAAINEHLDKVRSRLG